MNLPNAAFIIVQECRANEVGGTEQAQVYCVAEEAGEFVGAMRRWRGLARRSGTEAEAQSELADLIITAYVMAEIMGWNVEEIVQQKLEVIFRRGWKEDAS